MLCVPAVQEERQRGKDRNENEVESTSSANEDMPVEKILEAELAVEPKTETYVEANVGLNPSSVSAAARAARCSGLRARGAPAEGPVRWALLRRRAAVPVGCVTLSLVSKPGRGPHLRAACLPAIVRPVVGTLCPPRDWGQHRVSCVGPGLGPELWLPWVIPAYPKVTPAPLPQCPDTPCLSPHPMPRALAHAAPADSSGFSPR